MRYDPTTHEAFRTAANAKAAAEAVRDSLGSGTLTCLIKESGTTRYSGTFAGPLSAGPDGSLGMAAACTGSASSGGTPSAATWTLTIQNAGGTRWIEGSFGPGGSFNWDAGTLAAGQGVYLSFRIDPIGQKLFPVAAHSSGRYLVRADGGPHYLHGDTAWSLAVACTRAQIESYLNDRAARGFNCILVNLIEHAFNSAPAYRNAEGYDPFTTMSPVAWNSPNSSYWGLVDFMVDAAAARGMIVLATPCYAGYGGGSEGWHTNVIAASQANMIAYGNFLGGRYKDKGNVIWVMYGDYAVPSGDRARYQDVIDGILAYDSDALVTAHSDRGYSSRDSFSGDSRITIDVVYSGLDDAYSEMATVYARSPVLPGFLFEGYYEGHASGTAARVRAQPWSVLCSGGCGAMFGHEGVWPFGTGGMGGAWTGGFSAAQGYFGTTLTGHMAHVKAMTDAVAWHLLQPKTGTELVTTALSSGASRICPALASDGSFALVWVPTATSPTIALSALSGPNVLARWYDPTAGTYTAIGTYAATGTQSMAHPGNNAAGASDWVLRLDSVA